MDRGCDNLQDQAIELALRFSAPSASAVAVLPFSGGAPSKRSSRFGRLVALIVLGNLLCVLQSVVRYVNRVLVAGPLYRIHTSGEAGFLSHDCSQRGVSMSGGAPASSIFSKY